MKRTYEVVYGNGLTISKPNYENEKPLYSLKSIVELTDGEQFDETAEYNRLKSVVDPLVRAHYQSCKMNLSGVRIRERDGKKYPSVTSILSPDPFAVDEEYGIRGVQLENVMKIKFETDDWFNPQLELHKIKYSDIPYKDWWEKYKKRLDFTSVKSIVVYNKRLKYSGEIDLVCMIDEVPTIVDIKTGQWKWEQLVAYSQCDEMNLKQVAIFDLKKCEMPILELGDRKSKDAWENFLIKRGEFKARFGV